MKNLCYSLLCFVLLQSCSSAEVNSDVEKNKINIHLDSWHEAAAQADFEKYFSLIADNGTFIGTDATENWNKKDFQSFAKPYFDKGNAWTFRTLERNIFIGPSGNIAWFDELLDTEMKICRGSGVFMKHDGKWKIQHYVLSMTVPNDLIDSVIKIKGPVDDLMVTQFQSK